MLNFLKKLLFGGRDDDRRHETGLDDKGRLLKMDKPMSAAGAQLAGERNNKSETERALERSTDRAPKQE